MVRSRMVGSYKFSSLLLGAPWTGLKDAAIVPSILSPRIGGCIDRPLLITNSGTKMRKRRGEERREGRAAGTIREQSCFSTIHSPVNRPECTPTLRKFCLPCSLHDRVGRSAKKRCIKVADQTSWRAREYGEEKEGGKEGAGAGRDDVCCAHCGRLAPEKGGAA